MTEENKAIVEQYSEYVQEREWNQLRGHVTEDFVVHEPRSLEPDPVDIEEHIEALKPFDWHIEIKDIFSEGNKVATREVLYATQIEEYQGLPPSDEQLSATSILIWRIEDGKVAEVWSSPDSHEMLDQLGVTFPEILVTIPKILLRKILP